MVTRRRVIELLSTLPLVGLGITNFFAKRKYYEIDLSQAKTRKTEPSLQKLNPGSGAAFQTSLDRLGRVYEDAYYVSTTVPVTSTDANGNVSVTLQTTWDWEEPRNVPNHNIIFGWRDAQRAFLNQINYLHGPLVDGERIQDIAVDEKEASGIGMGALGALMYGGEIVALLGYEEAIAYFNTPSYRRTSLKENVERTNTDGQMSRRSWFKCGAALAGATAAGVVTNHNREQNESGKSELEQTLAVATKHQRLTPLESFQRYFGTNPLTEEQRIQGYVNISDKTLQSSVKDRRVTAAFKEVINTGVQYQNDLSTFFASEEFADTLNPTYYGYITRRLEESSADKGKEAKLGLLYEGAAVAGALALVLVPAEIISSRVARNER